MEEVYLVMVHTDTGKEYCLGAFKKSSDARKAQTDLENQHVGNRVYWVVAVKFFKGYVPAG